MRTGEVFVLTGAGISRESGIHTFRDADGIWASVSLQDVATPEGFARDPERVHAFYNARRQKMKEDAIAPNAAHFTLARLEREWRWPVTIVTQNIDGLHEQAGSTRVIHMHGRHDSALCAHCDARIGWHEDLSVQLCCTSCGKAGGMRPDIVWFGEMPYEMTRIHAALAKCRIFLSIGTSGSVYPAADFVELAGANGAHCVELNLEDSQRAGHFAEAHHGPASQVVPNYVERMLGAAV